MKQKVETIKSRIDYLRKLNLLAAKNVKTIKSIGINILKTGRELIAEYPKDNDVVVSGRNIIGEANRQFLRKRSAAPGGRAIALAYAFTRGKRYKTVEPNTAQMGVVALSVSIARLVGATPECIVFWFESDKNMYEIIPFEHQLTQFKQLAVKIETAQVKFEVTKRTWKKAKKKSEEDEGNEELKSQKKKSYKKYQNAKYKLEQLVANYLRADMVTPDSLFSESEPVDKVAQKAKAKVIDSLVTRNTKVAK